MILRTWLWITAVLAILFFLWPKAAAVLVLTALTVLVIWRAWYADDDTDDGSGDDPGPY